MSHQDLLLYRLTYVLLMQIIIIKIVLRVRSWRIIRSVGHNRIKVKGVQYKDPEIDRDSGLSGGL